MMTAFSVDPKPSHTVQSNRRPNSSMSRSLASLPNATRNGLSRVVGLFGGGQDVGQRLADVVHVGRAVAPDVGQEPRRGELRRAPSRPRRRARRSSPRTRRWSGTAASPGSRRRRQSRLVPLRPARCPRTAPSACGTSTALGSPLVPEVKIIMKVSSGVDLAVRHQRGRLRHQSRPLRAGHVDAP